MTNMSVITSKKHTNRMCAFRDINHISWFGISERVISEPTKTIPEQKIISDNKLQVQQNPLFMRNNYLTVTEIKVVEWVR